MLPTLPPQTIMGRIALLSELRMARPLAVLQQSPFRSTMSTMLQPRMRGDPILVMSECQFSLPVLAAILMAIRLLFRGISATAVRLWERIQRGPTVGPEHT